MSIHRFSFPTQICFGVGTRNLVAEHLKSVGVWRPLIVTDRGVPALPFTHTFSSDLKRAGLEPSIFGDVWGNPTAGQVAAGAAAFKACAADGVIGLGGGAALDVAKSVALLSVHDGDILEYAWD